MQCHVKLYNASRFEDPKFESDKASGVDLRADLDAPLTLWPMTVTVVPTGIYLEIEEGFEGQVRARSGLAARHGIALVNGIGTIDADYRGEIRVILINLKQSNYTIEPGERIAQLVFMPVATPVVSKVESLDALSQTERAEGGFGHSGKH